MAGTVVGGLYACGGSNDPAGGAGGAAGSRDAGPRADSGAVPDAGADAPDAPPVVPACVESPTPAPFPTDACGSPRPPSPDVFDEALGLAGLDRCRLAIDPKHLRYSGWDAADPRRLPNYDALVVRPLLLPGYAAETARWLDDAMSSPTPVTRAIVAASVRRGAPVNACADAAWFAGGAAGAKDPAPLATAIIAASEPLGGIDADAVVAAVKGVPVDLQRALGPVVRAIGVAYANIVAARGTTDDALLRPLAQMPGWVIGTVRQPLTPKFLAALDAVDVAKITEAAARVALVVEQANLQRFVGQTTGKVDLETPFGAIVIRGPEADQYAPETLADGAALVVDTGGEDVYRVPVGVGGPSQPIGVAVDLGGNDTYAYVEKKTDADGIGHRPPSDEAGRSGITRSRIGRQGSGVLGAGLLFDYGSGRDTYQSLAVSQGVGVLGVGVLYDDGGDDTYWSETLSQGASAWGVGLLLDRAGDDKYTSYHTSQGFGGTQGVGALVDRAGDDVYLTDPGDPALKGDPLYPSAQLPGKGNTSMSQGCGQGRRFDTIPERIGFLGGLGVLRDAAGNDSYTASVFAQGCGFLGAGLFLEGGGNDTYEGLWYVQGAAAHLGLAYFHDKGGNDRYDLGFPTAATSIAAGHDFSTAIHFDEGGDDNYRAPNLSLGSGHANGVGILANVGGADVFKASSEFTLGGAAAGEVFKGIRGTMPTYGVFVKAGGSATYEIAGKDVGRAGKSWSYAPEKNKGGAGKSVGVDRATGTVVLP